MEHAFKIMNRYYRYGSS